MLGATRCAELMADDGQQKALQQLWRADIAQLVVICCRFKSGVESNLSGAFIRPVNAAHRLATICHSAVTQRCPRVMRAS